MQSRIFQASTKPIKREDYVCADNYYDHWFTITFADYVSDDCNRDEDIKWLKESVNGIKFGNDKNGDYLVIINKEDYFNEAFKRFKNHIDKLKDCTIQQFTSGIPCMYTLKNAYEEKFGFYIDVDEDLMTLDSFVREATENKKYYIGNTIDYHF